MKKLIFSQPSIFHLYRLGIVVAGITGRRYRLEDQQELFSLIRYCARSPDLSIQRQFDAFLSVTEESLKLAMANMKLLDYSAGYNEQSQARAVNHTGR